MTAPEAQCGCGDPIPGYDPDYDEPRVCDSCRACIRGESDPDPYPSQEELDAFYYARIRAVQGAGPTGFEPL